MLQPHARTAEWACCSEGDLPDMKPKPQSDGTCATYTILANDNCWAIANSHGPQVKDLEVIKLQNLGLGGMFSPDDRTSHLSKQGKHH